MDAKLNADHQITKHAKLIEVLSMIVQCQYRIESDEDAHQSSLFNFTQKQELRERIAFRQNVLKRLNAYYAKHLFRLAGDTYNTLTPPQQPTTPLLPN